MGFDVAAEAYDRFMGAWSRMLSPQLADLADVQAGRHVIDVGCGPGSLTGELVARVGAGRVAAVDPSEPFVAAAQERYPGVDVRRASAEDLPYPDDTFDVALAQLVVHFMTDPVEGIGEMARVTRPNGTVAACVWDFGGGRGPLGPFWDVAEELDPTVPGEAHLPGARRGHLTELFGRAGLEDVLETDLAVTRPYASFDEWWQPFTRGVGPAGAFVASLAPEARDTMRDRCRSRLPDGPFDLTAHAWAARGRVR